MKHIDIQALVAEIEKPWKPAELCRFDGYHAFVVVIEGSFYPHRHNRDEFYYVLEGEAEIQVNGETRTVRAGEALLIEAGEEHHTSAASRAVLLVIEARSISYEPTGKGPDEDVYQGGPI